MTRSNGIPSIVPADKLNKASEEEVKEVMKMIDSVVPKDVHTKAAEAARFASDEAVLTSIAQRDLANTQLELAQEQMKQLRQRLERRPTVVNNTTTININFPAQPTPQRRVLNPDASLMVSIGVLFFALAVAAVMAYGLAWGYFRPFAAVSTLAPITVPAQTVRISGTVDISAVAENDRGIDYRSRQNGQYELFQLSTGYTIAQNGTTILVDASGTRVFR